MITLGCTKYVCFGEKIYEKLKGIQNAQDEFPSLEDLQDARLLLLKSRLTYESRKPLQTFSVLGGIVFAFVIGLVIFPSIQGFITLNTFKLADREELDRLLNDIYGKDQTFDDILTDELVLKTYEYNSQESRLFSKYFKD